MPPTLTAPQREALRSYILDRLSGIDGVWLSYRQGDLATAERLGREFVDELQLLNEDLKWDGEGGEGVTLTLPPELLRRFFERLRGSASCLTTSEERERQRCNELERQTQLISEASEGVLAQLDSGRTWVE